MRFDVIPKILPAGSLAHEPLDPGDIFPVVTGYYNVTRRDLMGPARHQAVATPRAVAMYLIRGFTHSSFPEIGALFGGRDHSTVMSAVRKVARQIVVDQLTKAVVEQLKYKLKEVSRWPKPKPTGPTNGRSPNFPSAQFFPRTNGTP